MSVDWLKNLLRVLKDPGENTCSISDFDKVYGFMDWVLGRVFVLSEKLNNK